MAAGESSGNTVSAEEKPPVSERGVIGWLHHNLFASWRDGAITIVCLLVAGRVLAGILDWAVVRAVFTGEDRTACLGANVGACWPFITHKLGAFFYGRYPEAERWRVDLTYLLLLAGVIPLLLPRLRYKGALSLYLLLVFPLLGYVLLTGGMGLTPVPTELWGGLLVTLVVSIVGIVASFPLGVLLAFGRRSDLPVLRWASIIYIEVVRGVPLVLVLFTASVMLPLFLPPDVTVDKLLRALVGVTLFSAAYLAEVVRGGLQAIPRGQFEAADALGLKPWHKTLLIVLPQALKLVIPGIVNSFIALFKDTSLVLIIGLFDLLGIVQQAIHADTRWASPATATTGYVFAGAVFWAFCFAMSRASSALERRLSQGERAGS